MTREELFEMLENGAKWNVGVSIARTNPLPLDANSLFKSVADAETYAESNPLAFIGQQLVVIDESSNVTAYLIKSVGASKELVKLTAQTSSGDVIEDVRQLQAKVSQLEGYFQEGKAKTALDAEKLGGQLPEYYATAESVTTLGGKVDTNTSNITGVTERVGSLETQIKGLTGAMHFVGNSTTDPAQGTVTIDGKPEYSAVAGDVVLYNKKEYVYNGEAWQELGDEGSHLTKTEAAATYETKENVNSKVQELTQKDTELAGKVTALESAGYITETNADAKYVAKEEGKSLVQDTLISKLEGLAEIKSVNTSEFDINGETKELSVKLIEQSKVNGLPQALAAKAEKTVVDSLVTSVGTSEDPASAEGSLFARIAKLKEDLTSVEENAGKIDVIKVNGVVLEIAEDKSVDIPLATAERLGVVKSADANDKIKVEADGTMSVNKITTDKLVQGSEELVLNGGSAA